MGNREEEAEWKLDEVNEHEYDIDAIIEELESVADKKPGTEVNLPS